MSDYIKGLEKAIEILEHSSEADEMALTGNFLKGAKIATSNARQLILDEIIMTMGERKPV